MRKNGVDEIYMRMLREKYSFEELERRVDEGWRGGVFNYVHYGISPGSCLSFVIRGNYNEAIYHAHPGLFKYNGCFEGHCVYAEKYIQAAAGGEMGLEAAVRMRKLGHEP